MSAGGRPDVVGGATEPRLDRLAGLAGKAVRAPVAFVSGFGASLDHVPSATARSLAGLVETSGEPVAVADVQGDPLAAADGAVAAFAGVPLRGGGGVVGSLCVADTVARRWSDEELATLADLAATAEAGLELDRLEGCQRAARDEQDRSVALLDSVWWMAPVALGFFDIDLRFTRVNEALAEINGVGAGDHLGHTAEEVLGELGAEMDGHLRGVLSTGRALTDVEVSGVTPAQPGVLRHWLASYYPVRGASQQTFAIGVAVVEVSERVRIEEERLGLLAAERAARLESERTGRRLAALQALTDRLSDVEALDEVVAAVEAEVAPLLEAGEVRLEASVDDDGAGRPRPAGQGPGGGSAAGIVAVEQGPDGGALAHVTLGPAGRPVGRLVLSWPGPRSVTAGERAFLAAAGDQCAQAVERARLRQAERRTRRYLGFLADASRALTQSPESEMTLAAVARLAVPDIAAACAVHLVEDGGVDDGGVALVAVAHVDPVEDEALAGLARRHHRVRHDTLEAALAAGGPVPYPGRPRPAASLPGDDRRHLALLRSDDGRVGVAVALRARGNRLGVLSVWVPVEAGRPVPDWAWVEDLAARIAGVLEGARLSRARAAEAEILQRSLMPPAMPAIPGLDLASRYHPASDAIQVGGDFYDVFPIGEGCWGVVMGDVSGKGVAAASLTALARYTVRAAALEGRAPSHALQVLNQAILHADVGDRFCTIALASVRPDSNGADVTLALGGHPRPLVVRADGSSSPVGSPGTAMGLFSAPELTDAEVRLGLGDALVLYTDGFLEVRSPEGSWAEGLFEASLAGGAGRDADGLASTAEGAVLTFEGDRPRDDMALLVVRVPVAGEQAAPGELRSRLPTQLGSSAVARRHVRAWLARQMLAFSLCDDIVLVVSELVTNAARAGRSQVELRMWRTVAAIVVEVSDDGEGFAPPVVGVAPPPEAETGRGLYLVRVLTDSCEFIPGPWGTLARCRFRVER